MNFFSRFIPVFVAGATLLAACGQAPEEDATIGNIEEGPSASASAELSSTVLQQRADLIKAAASAKGITNALIIAGVAYQESRFAQCQIEYGGACSGPTSPDCGGGAVLAGGGDGDCTHEKGGLGMFQLDNGYYQDTLAHYAGRPSILTVNGNILAGVDYIYEMVWNSTNTPYFPNRAAEVAWINSAVPGTAAYEVWLTTVAWLYNGCAPNSQLCDHQAIRADYNTSTLAIRDMLGAAYWSASPPPPSGSGCTCTGGKYQNGTTIAPELTFCGMRVCGGDHHDYECTAAGWQTVPGSTCGYGACSCSGGKDDQQRVISTANTECGYRTCATTHTFYDCASSGWVNTNIACSSTAASVNSCSCTQGIDSQNHAIDPASTFCGFQTCGLNNTRWECTPSGWSSLGTCSGGSPVCQASAPGYYCGNDSMGSAVASTLYTCPGANQAPTAAQACANGCVVAPAGVADYCSGGPPSPGGYRLPWSASTSSMQLTQDCAHGDHSGVDNFAWDFAKAGPGGGSVPFPLVAARAGTIRHLKMNSTTGGGSDHMGEANYIVIDHGDGTQSTYLHLQGNSLAAGLSCGAHVNQGQALAIAGSTGWSSAPHVHFQVNAPTTAASCECGTNGMGCAAGSVQWDKFWPDGAHLSKSVTFDEWPATHDCNHDLFLNMPTSMN